MKIRIYYFLISLIDSFPLANLLILIRPLLQKYFRKRAALNLDSIGELSKNIPLGIFVLTTPELHKTNDWYGNATFLKKYAGIDKNYSLKAIIEHGLYFGEYIWKQDTDSDLPIILTFSNKRATLLEDKVHKKTFAIGPYIHYVDDCYNEDEYGLEQRKLGKNLLVFPVHSTAALSVRYDTKQFIEKIKKIGKNFDSIRICLYWKDILLKIDELYRSAGFECVTAGHIYDPFFTSRLKSIISLSTTTMTNAVGTYSGYAIFMNKPHYIYKQNLNHQGNWSGLDGESLSKIRNDLQTIEEGFASYQNYISKRQYEIGRLYWGFDQIKKPGQLRKIFQKGEGFYTKS